MSSVFRDRPNKVPPSYNPIPDTFTPLPQQRKPRDEGKLKRQFYTDIKRVFRRNPTHTTLSQRDYDTAVATNSIYQEDPSAYLQSKSSPYRINRQVSRNVMSLRNIETGEDVVIVKGINPRNASDYGDVATLSQFGGNSGRRRNSKVYQEALAEAKRIDADAVFAHSRGNDVAQLLNMELGIPSVGFNGYTSPQTLYDRLSGKFKAKHTEHNNLADPVGTLNDLSGLSPNPEKFELRTYAPIKGGTLLEQHDMPQFIENLERHASHQFEDIDVIATSNKIADISTAQMFHKGVKQGKSYTEILKENEDGFGILNRDGTIGVRGGRGSNMSQMFEAVGGRHTSDELRQMERIPEGDYAPLRLSNEEITHIRNGKGVDMIHDIHDTIQDTYQLPRGAKWNSTSLARASGGMILASFAGDAVASQVDEYSPLKGEARNIQHSGVSFAVASGLLEGSSAMGLGFGAGVAGEITHYGTEKLLSKVGASEEVTHNLSAFTSGATSGAILASSLGLPGMLIGSAIGGVVSEAMYAIPKLFHKGA